MPKQKKNVGTNSFVYLLQGSDQYRLRTGISLRRSWTTTGAKMQSGQCQLLPLVIKRGVFFFFLADVSWYKETVCFSENRRVRAYQCFVPAECGE